MRAHKAKKPSSLIKSDVPSDSHKLQILRIQQLLKQSMHSREFRYEDLARHFKVSLSTAKRLLAADDLSFERLLQFCAWLDIDISQLLAMANIPSVAYEFYTFEQEEYLAQNPRAFAFLKLLLRGSTVADVVEDNRYDLALKEARALLKELERERFLDRLPEDRFRLFVKPRNDWRVDGPLWRTYMQQNAQRYVSHFFKPQDQKSDDHRHMEYGHRRLTPESYISFKKEIDDLYKKYLITSELEVQTFRPSNLVDMTCLFLVDQFVPSSWPTLERLSPKA